ncbi:MAG: Asp-tRNA(Asn)/Glu-tRNA(Gln) amidotransferase subunit GatA [Chloroflexi bacterium]|nr:Asp-tRNA(Asn)/Glu-tRNA(Gln) amidotransferase subunit GatA [Chloroflexota bacterium]
MSADLGYLSIAEAAARFRNRTLSPVEVVEALLDRIDALDGRLHAYLAVMAESAMAEARQSEQELLAGQDRGPLHGIPIALKDLYATAGTLTTAGSPVLADWVPEEDATVVTLLRQAGAVNLGKLTMHEFAFGPPALDDPYPPARNPWNLDHVPGGSSSGSGAALAAGLCLGSLGSDTGGSIRGPASFCGITGLKPTYGRVSRAGVVPLAWSLDHVGPMTRSAEDCALMLQAIAGYDPKDPASSPAPVPDYRATLGQGLAGVRLGVCRPYFLDHEALDPDVRQGVEQAIAELRGAGASVVEVGLPHAEQARIANTVIMLAEAYAYHEQTLQTRGHLFGKRLRLRLLEGGLLRASDYLQAQRTRSLFQEELGAALRQVDVLITPTSVRPASSWATFDPAATARDPSYTAPFNLTGVPVLSVPCGFSAAGLPLGMQIVGRSLDEATVLRVGHAYQQLTDWHTRQPAGLG